jgi:hypothetical protein
MNVFIFGDQTADQIPLLRKIVSRRDNSLLATFLERCSSALREEVQALPKPQRDSIPDFLTISQLVQAYQETDAKVPQLESVLVTIAQLGHYIGLVTCLASYDSFCIASSTDLFFVLGITAKTRSNCPTQPMRGSSVSAQDCSQLRR